MELDFEDETAIVTASSSGLGKASAEALAAEGANVVVCSRSAERVDAAVEDVRENATGSVLGVEADITDVDDIAALVDATVETFGGIDHLVTSAGGPPSGGVLDLDERDWYEAFDLLVMSVVRLATRAHPHLVDSERGTITAITSTSVAEPIDGLVLSNAVRRAVIGFVKTVAREWAPDVRANAVLPGAHETPRITEVVDATVERGEYDTYDEALDAWADDIPLGRVGDPRTFGDAVAFLASDRAAFVNGASLPVDGGRLRS